MSALPLLGLAISLLPSPEHIEMLIRVLDVRLIRDGLWQLVAVRSEWQSERTSSSVAVEPYSYRVSFNASNLTPLNFLSDFLPS